MRLAHLNILLNTIVTLTIFPGVPSDVDVSTALFESASFGASVCLV